jgi:hypothetical protein
LKRSDEKDFWIGLFRLRLPLKSSESQIIPNQGFLMKNTGCNEKKVTRFSFKYLVSAK